MVIGIIGASISGLIAGQRLAKAGHDVTVIERNYLLGGKFATKKMGNLYLDYGISHFSAAEEKNRNFVNGLQEQGVVRQWADGFNFYDAGKLHEMNPHSARQPYFTGTKGMQSIVQNLSRWVDLIPGVGAGGLTYIGPDRTKKRSWVINLSDFSVFECDAVIIAAPAVEAYGILQTAQDETPVRQINSVIDEVRYDSCFSLLATYDHPAPEWKGIECRNPVIDWIGNESSKVGAETGALQIRSSADFYRKHVQKGDKKIQQLLLDAASTIIGTEVLQPETTYLHRWTYFKARNPINEYFMELEMKDGPLALIGDYFRGNEVEDAFLSGYNLSEYWINKYSHVAV